MTQHQLPAELLNDIFGTICVDLTFEEQAELWRPYRYLQSVRTLVAASAVCKVWHKAVELWLARIALVYLDREREVRQIVRDGGSLLRNLTMLNVTLRDGSRGINSSDFLRLMDSATNVSRLVLRTENSCSLYGKLYDYMSVKGGLPSIKHLQLGLRCVAQQSTTFVTDLLTLTHQVEYLSIEAQTTLTTASPEPARLANLQQLQLVGFNKNGNESVRIEHFVTLRSLRNVRHIESDNAFGQLKGMNIKAALCYTLTTLVACGQAPARADRGAGQEVNPFDGYDNLSTLYLTGHNRKLGWVLWATPSSVEQVTADISETMLLSYRLPIPAQALNDKLIRRITLQVHPDSDDKTWDRMVTDAAPIVEAFKARGVTMVLDSIKWLGG